MVDDWAGFKPALTLFPLGQLRGAVAAVVFVQVMTSSELRDIGGPIDVIVLLGVAGMGAVGAAILVYTIQSLFFRKSDA